jgi:hypothetical protein
MAQAIGITLPLQLGNTGYFEQSFDTLTQVKSNFINLILTRKGERVHQPEFGCCIHNYLLCYKCGGAVDAIFRTGAVYVECNSRRFR